MPRNPDPEAAEAIRAIVREEIGRGTPATDPPAPDDDPEPDEPGPSVDPTDRQARQEIDAALGDPEPDEPEPDDEPDEPEPDDDEERGPSNSRPLARFLWGDA